MIRSGSNLNATEYPKRVSFVFLSVCVCLSVSLYRSIDEGVDMYALLPLSPHLRVSRRVVHAAHQLALVLLSLIQDRDPGRKKKGGGTRGIRNE